MPNWNDVLAEIQQQPLPLDQVRRKYLAKLADKTGRNVIAYYSGWLSIAERAPALYINDEDKNAFMTTIHGLDRGKGLDLILHTPGGGVAQAESLVHYLRQMFGTNIRAIVPQLAMSAGTMIACACRSIVMGLQSNLGPIDPQINGIPAHGVIQEFKEALEQIKQDPASIHVWQPIIGRYHPTFLGECEKAIEWAERIVRKWLQTGMFSGRKDRDELTDKVLSYLGSHDETLSHSRHIHMEECEKLGLVIEKLEDDQELQDLVLTVHHAYMHTINMARVLKIVENHIGRAMILGLSPRS